MAAFSSSTDFFELTVRKNHIRKMSFLQDPWIDLPVEIACEIITRITDLRSLLNYMQTSKTFYRLSRLCTRVIDSPVKVEVPLSYFTGFQNLQIIGGKIRVRIDPDISALSTLPGLRAANLIYNRDVEEVNPDELHDLVKTILANLGLGRKIPQVDFRIVVVSNFNRIGLIIQGDRFDILGVSETVSRPIVETIKEAYPQLQYLGLSNLSANFTLVNRDFRNFLLEADFGLTDPTRPPSENNPRFSVDDLSDSGLLPRYLILDLILLYGWHNGLIENGVLYLDDLMRKYIQPALIEENLQRSQYGLETVPLDRIIFSHRPNTIVDYVSGHFTPRWGHLEQFDLPTFLPDLQSTETQVQRLLSYYQT